MSTDSKTPTLNETSLNSPRFDSTNSSTNKRVKFKPPRKTMSTPVLTLQSAIKIRKDIFGEIIKKGGKQKISFADDALKCVNEDDEDSECLSEKTNKKIKKIETTFIEIIDVESYKEENKMNAFKSNGIIDNEDVCCETCEIF